MQNRITWIIILGLAMALLAGCGGDVTETVPPEDIPPVTQSTEGIVLAEAVIEPLRWAELRFDLAGDVAEVLVQEGDQVQTGDPLARLETTDLERALAQAELNLRQAELRLEQIREPADETDVELAEAAVSEAASAYQEARKSLQVTEHSISVGDEVRAARFQRDEAYRKYQSLVNRLGEDDHRTEAAHDAYLDALGAYNRALESSELELTRAQNDVTQAYNALQQAQNELDDLLEGTDETDIETAQLDVRAAELSLEEAEKNLEEAVLIAPFAGTVSSVSVEPGDTVSAGQVVVVLATLDQLQARTRDLTELDVVQVEVGQSVQVSVDALPDQTFEGTVREIALQAGDYRGDVVYDVLIDLSEAANERLRWGMTALVEIETE
jgi:HlyD family secretion protein